MSTVNVITIIAVILFARLGVRLYVKYQKINKKKNDNSEE